MKRYASKIEDDTLYVEGRDGWLEIGTTDEIIDHVGGETYSIQYDSYGQSMDWVDTDDDGVFTFDVLEVLEDMTFPEDFIDQLERVDDERSGNEASERLEFYVDMMTEIWDSKGNIGTEEEVP